MKTKTFPIIGTKSSLLWDEDTDAWTYLSGEPIKDNTPRIFHQLIPTLFRSVDIRASAIANLPWALMKGKDEYELSDDYQNKTGLVSNMDVMLYLIEASLVLAGVAYWKREKNPAGFNKLRHLNPASMKLDEKKADKGEIEWKRGEGSGEKIYTPKEIVYFWYPDPYVEIGPPASWPAKSALTACGVLANMDEFARSYFGRGAIKAMLFSMQGASPNTAQEFEGWWNKYITGIKNAFRTKVINAETVTPIVVGEGIQELSDVTLSQEKKEEIAIACSIPMSILFANAANYATAERDKLNWYEDKIVPEAKFIASILNEQLFDEFGLRLTFLPETLDIFQEDEKERAMAVGYYFNAGMPLLMSCDILGVELTDAQRKELEELEAKKEEQAEELASNLTSGDKEDDTAGGAIGAGAPKDPKQKPEAFGGKAVDPQQLQRELSLWLSKCLKALDRGELASSVAFVPVYIPADKYDLIAAGLEDAAFEVDVKDVFAYAFRDDDDQREIVSVYGTNSRAADKMRVAISQWKEIALSGESVEFDREAIPPTLAAAIEGALEETETEDDIAQVFADIWLGYP